MAGDAQAKEVEQRDTDGNCNTRVEDRGNMNSLVPSPWEIKEGGSLRDGWNGKDGEQQENR
jgi:hypothetical protein